MKKILCLLLLCATPLMADFRPPIDHIEEEESFICSKAFVSSWRKLRIDFGFEKIGIRFPSEPLATQERGVFIASAFDQQVLYKFIGYFPPIGNIDPHAFFQREVEILTHAPYILIGQVAYQTPSFDWVLDTTAHDLSCNMIIKQRMIITPFNAYTLQAVFPYGLAGDQFDYFLQTFSILTTR